MEKIYANGDFTVKNVFLTNMLSGNYNHEVKFSCLQLVIQHMCHIQTSFCVCCCPLLYV